MHYKHVPHDPKDLTLPGLTFKSKERRKYERAMWPEFRLDQFTLMPKEDLAPKQLYIEFGGRLYNLSQIGKWSDSNIWAFFKGLQDPKVRDVLGPHEWALVAMYQWQLVAAALWREMFSEDGRNKGLPEDLEVLKTRFVEWARSLSPGEEIDALDQIAQMDYEVEWWMLRLFIEARKDKTLRRERPGFDEGDPFWPAIRAQLRMASYEMHPDDLYEFALKFLGQDSMGYYDRFMEEEYLK